MSRFPTAEERWPRQGKVLPKWSKKTICPLPFMAIHGDGPNLYSPCCYNKNPAYKKYKTINEYFASPELKNLQENLITGIKDKSCETCWHMEDAGITSMRQEVSKDRLKHIETPAIKQLQLQTGYTCNISCMMCNPGVSSNLNQLWKNTSMKKYNESWDIKRLTYCDDEETYIKNNKNDIEYIDVAGGEPLYNKRFLSLCEWLTNQNVAKNITLYITTNGTVMTDKMLKVFENFKKTTFILSLEGIGPVNDYIRWNSNFKIIEENFKKITKNFYHQVAHTTGALNIHRLQEVHDFANSYDSIIESTIVNRIPALLPKNCASYLKSKVPTQFKKLIQEDGNDTLLKNFILAWDKQRKCSILDYMPEYKQLLEN